MFYKDNTEYLGGTWAHMLVGFALPLWLSAQTDVPRCATTDPNNDKLLAWLTFPSEELQHQLSKVQDNQNQDQDQNALSHWCPLP